MYNYMSLYCTVSEIVNVNVVHAIEIWVRDHSRSLQMATFDRSYDFLSICHCTVSVCSSLEIGLLELEVEEYRDLEF